MKLPNAERAVVEREKIADYLLNPAHPDNGVMVAGSGQVHVFGQPFAREMRFSAEKWTSPQPTRERLRPRLVTAYPREE